MTALSIVEARGDGRPMARLIATPLFPISPMLFDPGTTFVFEILERDASALASRIGQACLYAIGSEATFWARLTSLEPCTSTHEGLAYLRDRRTLRATFAVLGSIDQAGQA